MRLAALPGWVVVQRLEPMWALLPRAFGLEGDGAGEPLRCAVSILF